MNAEEILIRNKLFIQAYSVNEVKNIIRYRNFLKEKKSFING